MLRGKLDGRLGISTFSFVLRLNPKFSTFRKKKLSLKVTDYITKLLSYEVYSFSLDELMKSSFKSKEALQSELRRLVAKGEIVNLRKGFYLILPPRYRSFGQLPLELFVEKLFEYLKKPYYVACLSAAKFHGAAHQQVQQDFIVTELPAVRDIEKPIRLNFVSSTHWPTSNIEKRKSEAGYFNLSSPALTALDLIHYQSTLGGLNKLFTVLEELSEEITPYDLQDILAWYPYKSALQRLGYLLDQFETSSELTHPIYEKLRAQGYYPTLLDPRKGQKAGATGNRWKIDANLHLESDL